MYWGGSTVIRAGIVLLGLNLFYAAPGSAQSNGVVEKFFGSYDGKGTWGTGMPPRALSVVIKPTQGGFNVSWESKSLKNPRRLKSKPHSINFIKTAKAGLYLAHERKGRADVPNISNPVKGKLPNAPLTWVRIEGDRMKLHFLRYLNTVPVKQTKGKLRRVAE